MSRLGDRLSGAVVLLFAGLLWLVVIPDQVDSASYGWMRPRTLPLVAATVLGVLGAALIVFATPRPVSENRLQAMRVGAVLALIGLAVLGIGQFGFLTIAPALALAISLLCGERRWPWVLAAGVAVPGAIWLIVPVLLSRPLP